MNISDITKSKFRITIAGAGILMMILYLFFVYPLRFRNSESMGKIESVLTQLKMYERKGSKVYNEKWIKTEEAKLEAIKNEKLKFKEFCKKQDNYIEKVFADTYGDKIGDEALWKNKYIQRVNVLLDKVAYSEISVKEKALPFKDWGTEIPTWDQIAKEQKRFWITEELINIVLKEELKIDSIVGINFREGSPSHDCADPDLYDIIPFTMKVGIDTEGILFLINELLKSKLCFEIKTFNALNRSGSGNASSLPSPSSVDVVIEVHALDFKV